MHANSVPGPENPEPLEVEDALPGIHTRRCHLQGLSSRAGSVTVGRVWCKVIESGEVWVKLETQGPLKRSKSNFFFLFWTPAKTSPQAVSMPSWFHLTSLFLFFFFSSNQRVIYCFHYHQSNELEGLCSSVSSILLHCPSPSNGVVYWFNLFSGFASLSYLLYQPHAKWTVPSYEEKDEFLNNELIHCQLPRERHQGSGEWLHEK